MKKIIYLAAVIMFSSTSVNAQVKSNKNQEKVKEVKSTESYIVGEESAIEPPFSVSDLQEDPEAVYNIAGLQVKPSFPGSFHSEVQKGIDPTDNGLPSPYKGRAYVNFIIEKDGSLSNIRCTRDPGHGLGKEVIEAVKKVQLKWNPGLQEGKAVRVSYTLPIEITIP